MELRIDELWVKEKKRLGFMKFAELYPAFGNMLKEMYPDANKRRAYHALIKSTMGENEGGINEDDFPGYDSVQTVLENGIETWKPPIDYTILILRKKAEKHQKEISKDGAPDFRSQIQEKSDELLSNYLYAKNWLAYHALLGTKLPYEEKKNMIREDFPGDDSVVSFLEKLAGETSSEK